MRTPFLASALLISAVFSLACGDLMGGAATGGGSTVTPDADQQLEEALKELEAIGEEFDDVEPTEADTEPEISEEELAELEELIESGETICCKAPVAGAGGSGKSFYKLYTVDQCKAKSGTEQSSRSLCPADGSSKVAGGSTGGGSSKGATSGTLSRPGTRGSTGSSGSTNSSGNGSTLSRPRR